MKRYQLDRNIQPTADAATTDALAWLLVRSVIVAGLLISITIFCLLT